MKWLRDIPALAVMVAVFAVISVSAHAQDYYRFEADPSAPRGAADSTTEGRFILSSLGAFEVTPSSVHWSGAPNTITPRRVTVQNSGDFPLNGVSVYLTGSGFAITGNSCPSYLAGGQFCEVDVTTTLTSGGSSGGVLNFASSGDASATVNLTANISRPGAFSRSPASLSWSGQATNISAQRVTINNIGDLALSGISASISGSGFSITGNSCSSLSGGQNCYIDVITTLTNGGNASATLNVTASGGASTSVSLGANVTVVPACTNATASYHWDRGPTGICAGVGYTINVQRSCPNGTYGQPSYTGTYRMRSDYYWQPGTTSMGTFSTTLQRSFAHGRDIAHFRIELNGRPGEENLALGTCKSTSISWRQRINWR